MSKKWDESPRDLLRAQPDFDLSKVDPDSTPGFDGDSKAGAKALTAMDEELDDLQERLFAAAKEGATDRVLVVLQAMDAAGKGGIVRHVAGLVDPQGLQIHAFKAPTDEEKSHNFLWRIRKQLPSAGMIGIFDRSHYEDVLIHRVRKLTPLPEIEKRYDVIKKFEAELAAGGTRVIKIMLHISKDEQRERLLERIDRPDKFWKYSPGDIDERKLWDDYMEAFQIAISKTSTDDAPWYVVPGNHKWYARLAVAQILHETLSDIDPQWPKATFDQAVERKRLAES